MILEFKVTEQTITKINNGSKPRKGSAKYLKLNFDFTSDWNNMDKTIYFQAETFSEAYDMAEKTVTVPGWYTEQDDFYFTIEGTGAHGERITTNLVKIHLEESGTIWVSLPPDTSDTAYRVLLEKIQRVAMESIAKPELDPNGKSGQILQSKGDGTARWVDDDPVTDEQLDAWMQAHPEATTTVQDGSLNESKMTPSFLLHNDLILENMAVLRASEKLLLSGIVVTTLGYRTPQDGGGTTFIVALKTDKDTDNGGTSIIVGKFCCKWLAVDDFYVEQFGAVGDGQTDDTDAITRALGFERDNYCTLNFRAKKTYVFNGSIPYYKARSIKYNYCTIKTTSPELIVVNTPQRNITIEDLSIVSDGTTEKAIRTIWCSNVLFKNLTVYNVKYGIYNEKGNFWTERVTLRNEMEIPGSAGITVIGTDSYIKNVIVLNFAKGLDIRNGLTRLNNVHVWYTLPNIIAGSVAFYVKGSATAKDIYADTCETGLVNDNGQLLFIDGMHCYNNQEFYTGGSTCIKFLQNGKPYPQGANKTNLIGVNMDNFKTFSNIDDLSFFGNNALQHFNRLGDNLKSRPQRPLKVTGSEGVVITNSSYFKNGMAVLNFQAKLPEIQDVSKAVPIGFMFTHRDSYDVLAPITRVVSGKITTEQMGYLRVRDNGGLFLHCDQPVKKDAVVLVNFSFVED